MSNKHNGYTVTDLADLPPSLGLEAAAQLLGIGRTNAYALARAGNFPVPVVRVGKLYRVPTLGVLRLLGAAAPDACRALSPDR